MHFNCYWFFLEIPFLGDNIVLTFVIRAQSRIWLEPGAKEAEVQTNSLCEPVSILQRNNLSLGHGLLGLACEPMHILARVEENET